MVKLLKFIQAFFLYIIGYLWYFAIYLVLIPYVVLLIGRSIDIFLFDYIFNLGSVFYYSYISIPMTVFFSFLGAGLVLWSFYTLYFYARCFPFNFFPFPGFNPEKLTTYGPYAIVRHPMVLGYLFLLIAFGFHNGSLSTVLWMVPIIGGVFYEYIKNREERRLSLWFGKEYEEYTKRTPLLIPGLKTKE